MKAGILIAIVLAVAATVPAAPPEGQYELSWSRLLGRQCLTVSWETWRLAAHQDVDVELWVHPDRGWFMRWVAVPASRGEVTICNWRFSAIPWPPGRFFTLAVFAVDLETRERTEWSCASCD